MTLHSFTHVALRFERLREAEALYVALFALAAARRETETPQGWRTVPAEASWEDIEAAGVRVGLVMLHRDGFRLALEHADQISREQSLID